MKKIFKIVIAFAILSIVLLSLYVYDIKTSESKVDRFVREILDDTLGNELVIQNTQFCRAIKYEYLSNEYHNKISKEEYEKINTVEEAAELFNSIDIDININSFNGHRYKDSSKFKTPIVSFYRIKNKPVIMIYNVIIGIQGQKPVIKRINIEVEDINSL